MPYPILLVIAGLALGFAPGIPRMALNPDLVFLAILPPLLYAAAWTTSWRDFSYNITSILLLAFGLVGFTVVGVAFTVARAFDSFDWRTGAVLGAVVSTTDAIAATSIARRVGLPQRIVDVLEGESLVNDASGLLALEFTTAMILRNETPSFGFGLFRLFYLLAAGIGLGLLAGVLVNWVEQHIDDARIEITLSFLVPYAVYLLAEALQASGVLAVVACGLYLSRKSAGFFSPQVRIQIQAVWQSVTFLLNGLVFVLIGLQLPVVLEGIQNISTAQLIRYGAVVSAVVILLRLLWIYPGAYLAFLIRCHVQGQQEKRPGAKQVFIVGWTGMRGVVALAAALSLPQTLPNGQPFPERNLIIFLTFIVILVTLVGQGLTLPPLIRALGLAGSTGMRCEEEEARRIVLEEAIAHVENLRQSDEERFSRIYDDMGEHYRHRLLSVTGEFEEGGETTAEHIQRYRAVARELLEVERKAAIRLRDERRISDEVLRTLEHELDLAAVRQM